MSKALFALMLLSASVVGAFQTRFLPNHHQPHTPSCRWQQRQLLVRPTSSWGNRVLETTALASSQQSPESNTGEDREDETLRKQRLEKLGFSVSTTTSSSSSSSSQDEPIKVRVDLIKNVDPVTLTAIGFTLLAINFLVLANMGDVGLAGIVARIINMSSQ